MKKKKIVIVVLCIAALIMSVGYAAFSTALNINGTANITSTWKVVFSNIEQVSKSSGVTEITTPTAAGTSATFNVSLTSPGDSIEYKITVANQGTLDAIIEDITASETGSDAIKFEITDIKLGDSLVAKSTKTFNVLISYDNSVTSQPLDVINELTINIKYVQDVGQTITSSSPNLESSTLTELSGTSSLTLSNSSGRALTNYRITGNSVQNGTPTPSAPIEVESVGKRTKNIIDYNNLFSGNSITTAGITYTKTSEGILVNGTSTNYAMTSRIALVGILEPGKTYVASGTSGGVQVIFSSLIDGSYNYSNTKTITGDETTITLYLQVNPNVTVNNVLIQPQLEEGNKSSSYEPYGYKIPVNMSNGTENTTTNIYLDEPLRKVGSSVDYIDFATKQIVRNIGKYTFTGNESIYRQVHPGNTSAYRFYTANKIMPSVKSSSLGFSTHLQYNNSPTSAGEIDNSISGYPADNMQIVWMMNSVTSVDNMKTWLKGQVTSGTPLELYYELAAADTTYIDLPILYTLSGNCTMSIDLDNDVSVPVDISYYQKT